jgi:hypothetical protein
MRTVVGFRTKKIPLGKIRVATIPPVAGERAGLYTGLELRRSKRIPRAVRLVIVGRDREGQPYRETMSTVSLSLHGCCYQSWHNSQIGAKVELRLREGFVERSPLVRARIRYVRPRLSHSELFHIGVEFDAPPRGWLSLQEETTLAGAPHVEVAFKPDGTSPAPDAKLPTVQPLAIARQELAVAERLTITIDELIAVLQGPLQSAAENAVEAGRAQLEETIKNSVQRDVARQLQDAVRQVLCMIDEISRANARQAESLLLQRLEQMMRSLQEEISHRVDARLEELLSPWEDQQEEQR